MSEPNPLAEGLAREMVERLRVLARRPWRADSFDAIRVAAGDFLSERFPDVDRARVDAAVQTHVRVGESRVEIDFEGIVAALGVSA